ncbi:peptide ABC transporter [Clostridium sp. 19966]|uniref:ABC transporter substrate-binding protein n=1 Tax=Clostridium sp. 19966 TaxID=2768166 RepID=UPI0028DDA442|nr:ABC transporter substrate-binding protein [Clostridium sp. 19966]MDT8715414.1 peptide ABC transporter [Clostridium sp. 19966]
MKCFFKTVIIALCTALLFSSCTEKKIKLQEKVKGYYIGTTIKPKNQLHSKDKIIIGINEVKGKFNPMYADSVGDMEICKLLFSSLISVNKNGDIILEAAESYKINDYGNTFDFKLKKGIKFSDGSELTAEDVAFTYEAFCDPSYKGMYSNEFYDLCGFHSFKQGNAKNIVGIRVIDKYNISFSFNDANFLRIYSFDKFILPKSHYYFSKGKLDASNYINKRPIGSGAYKFIASMNEEVSLDSNENYFKGCPKIAKVTVKKCSGNEALKYIGSGEVDMIKTSVNADTLNYLKSVDNLKLYTYGSNCYQYIGFNLRLDKFKDKGVRQALNYALNKEEFIKNYCSGYGSYNIPFLKFDTEDGINEYKHDLEKAARLMKEAGFEKREDGFLHNSKGEKFTIKWSTYEGNQYGEELKKQVLKDWGKLGIDVTVEKKTFENLVNQVYENQDFEMYNMCWRLNCSQDPLIIFSKEESEKGGNNAVGWINEKSDILIKKAFKEKDDNKKKNIYKELAKIIKEEVPYIFLNNGMEAWVVNERVKGLTEAEYKDWVEDLYNIQLKSDI